MTRDLLHIPPSTLAFGEPRDPCSDDASDLLVGSVGTL